jgi:hypothetical protein
VSKVYVFILYTFVHCCGSNAQENNINQKASVHGHSVCSHNKFQVSFIITIIKKTRQKTLDKYGTQINIIIEVPIKVLYDIEKDKKVGGNIFEKKVMSHKSN